MAHTSYYAWGFDDGVALACCTLADAARLRCLAAEPLIAIARDAHHMWHGQLSAAEMTEYLVGVTSGFSGRMDDALLQGCFVEA